MSKFKLGVVAKPEDEILRKKYRVVRSESEISIIKIDEVIDELTLVISPSLLEYGRRVLFESADIKTAPIFYQNYGECFREETNPPTTIATVVWNQPMRFDGPERITGFSDIQIICVYMITGYRKGGWVGGDANPAEGIHTGRKFRFLIDKDMTGGSLLNLLAETFGVNESSIQTSHGCPLVFYSRKSYYDLLPGGDGTVFELTGRELENKGLPNIWRSHPEGVVKIQRDTKLLGCGVNESGLICCQSFEYPY